MKQVDEIIYDAIQADATIMALTEGRVISTCFEIPPDAEDNTKTPNIIITLDGIQNTQGTKDHVWESDEDQVQVGVDVADDSPGGVKRLVRLIRRAVEQHIVTLWQQGGDVPELNSLAVSELAWDWTQPCYHQSITYDCTKTADTGDDDEEEED